MSNDCLKFLTVGTGAGGCGGLRCAQRPGGAPGLFWLGGFKSDMQGTKAQALDAWAERNGRALTRFDYSGHGESGGSFADGTIGRWLEESLAVFDACCRGPAGGDRLVHGRLAGAAAGARAGAAAAARGRQPHSGLVLIAPAVDFTEALMWERFSPEIRRQIEDEGRLGSGPPSTGRSLTRSPAA